MTIAYGLEHAAAAVPAALKDANVGVLFNQASVDCRFRYAADVLAEVASLRIRALFSPQHGLWGEEQANMIETPHGRFLIAPSGSAENSGTAELRSSKWDVRPSRTPSLALGAMVDVPLYSLYSEARKPTPAMLDGLDAFVIDLQDVGTRIYTYIWTVTHCLEACAERGLPVVLLDRPNPLGGVIAEGSVLDPAFTSFVGRAPIPMRHALTIGELAVHLNDVMGIHADLTVVPLQGWRREMLWPDTGRAWLPPSPNLPTFASALVYPGQVLLEGTNLSEGRGTTTPFEVMGAPFIDPFRLADCLAEQQLPGVVFRPVKFRPTFDKWAGESCGGIFLHVTDARAFRPYRTTLAILSAVKALWPREFAWRPPPYEYETVKMPIDILSGSSKLREWIDGVQVAAAPPEELLGAAECTGWFGRVTAREYESLTSSHGTDSQFVQAVWTSAPTS